MLLLAACEADGVVTEGHGTVRRIVDGDTIDVAIGNIVERVRLIGIDTPEIAHAGDSRPSECGGDAASAFTSAVLPVGSSVTLLRDVVPRDDYGRLLAYVKRDTDDVIVNLLIAEAGFAAPLHIPPNSRMHVPIAEAVARARSSGEGIWQACG